MEPPSRFPMLYRHILLSVIISLSTLGSIYSPLQSQAQAQIQDRVDSQLLSGSIARSSSTSALVRMRVLEESATGTLVGSLGPASASFGSGPASATEVAQSAGATRFMVLPPDFHIRFELDDRSGDVRVRSRIDREAMSCNSLPSTSESRDGRAGAAAPGAGGIECVLEYELVERPSMTMRRLAIVVDDVNDWAPSFQQYMGQQQEGFQSYIRELPENSEPFTTCVELPPPVDPDAGRNGVRNVSVRGGTDAHKFRVRLKQVPPTKFGDLCLYPIVALDRETQESYRLQIEALDGGSPPRSGVLNLSVLIADANDNSPVFERERYAVTLPENAARDSLIVRVIAHDVDKEDNAALAYSFDLDEYSSQPNVGFGDIVRPPFRIDPQSGAIYLADALDYESARRHELRVLVRDQAGQLNGGVGVGGVGGAHALDNGQQFGQAAAASSSGQPTFRTASALVIVVVTDVNDRAPELELRNADGQDVHSVVYVDENEPQASLVGLLTVSDADAGGRQGRSCSLAFPSSEPSSPATSAGRPGQPAPLRLEPAGPSAAEDLNQVGLYRLLTNAQLDRERQHTYRVTIRCTDTGEPPLSTTLEFQLIVLDRNDNLPEFSQNEYRLTVRENGVVGTKVGVLGLEDADEEVHAVRTLVPYSRTMTAAEQRRPPTLGLGAAAAAGPDRSARVSSGANAIAVVDDEVVLTVDALGVLRAARSFDRERGALYRMLALVSDPHLSESPLSTATVLLSILDENDNAPKFDVDHYAFDVFEHLLPPQRLGQLRASDSDEGKNAVFVYELHTPNELRDAFELTPSGELYLRRELDREALPVTASAAAGLLLAGGSMAAAARNDVLELEVVARDVSRPELVSRVPIYVRVLDINDQTPQFSFPSAARDTVAMRRELAPGLEICRVRATDGDRAHNAEVRYSLVHAELSSSQALGILGAAAGGARAAEPLFALDASSGALSLRRPLLDSDPVLHALLVRATDRGSPPLHSDVVLKIVVLTGNERDPYVPLAPTLVTLRFGNEQPQGPQHTWVLGVLLAASAMLLLSTCALVYVLVRCRQRRAHDVEARSVRKFDDDLNEAPVSRRLTGSGWPNDDTTNHMTGSTKHTNLLVEWTAAHSPVIPRLSTSSNRSDLHRLQSSGTGRSIHIPQDSESLFGAGAVHYIRNSEVGASGTGGYRSGVQCGGVQRGQSMCQLEVLGRERLSSVSSPNLMIIGRNPPKRSLTISSHSMPECQLEMVQERNSAGIGEDCDSGNESSMCFANRRQTECSGVGVGVACGGRPVRHSNTAATLARDRVKQQLQQHETCACASKPSASSCRAGAGGGGGNSEFNKGRLGHISYSVQNCNTVCCEMEMGAVPMRRPRLSTVDSETNECSECLLSECAPMRAGNCVALPPLEDKSPSTPPVANTPVLLIDDCGAAAASACAASACRVCTYCTTCTSYACGLVQTSLQALRIRESCTSGLEFFVQRTRLERKESECDYKPASLKEADRARQQSRSLTRLDSVN